MNEEKKKETKEERGIRVKKDLKVLREKLAKENGKTMTPIA